jgi:hypothetical protein
MGGWMIRPIDHGADLVGMHFCLAREIQPYFDLKQSIPRRNGWAAMELCWVG